MDLKSPLEDLKKVASKLSIDIITANLFYPEFMIKSGFCRVKGKNTIIVDDSLSSQEQCEIIIQALKRFDLESIYLSPWIRERLKPDNST
ncbi:uncharacterized protein METZ01_LOCUS201827 [marine metagenome]|uniref:Uncharacterized protein n=1 Tax=marine metagenome TaxID=408172 RepID=A0A382EG83_9ZZZZ|tara:strand:+ start:135 stop:404 length:270 start_codon:yes stop_codon:yes gene_type:complete